MEKIINKTFKYMKYNTINYLKKNRPSSASYKSLFYVIKKIIDSGYRNKPLGFFYSLRYYLQVFSHNFLIFLYGTYLTIYNYLLVIPIVNIILTNYIYISTIQLLLVLYIDPIGISFMFFSFYSFLYRVECFCSIIYVFDPLYIKSLIKLSKLMRRSPFFASRFIGRMGSTGFGGIFGGGPKGNGPQVVVWGLTVVTSVALIHYYKHKTDIHKITTQSQVDIHNTTTQAENSRFKTTTQAENSRFKTTTKAETARHNTDRSWDEYRKDKTTWDNRWIKGNPPTPPTPPTPPKT